MCICTHIARHTRTHARIYTCTHAQTDARTRVRTHMHAHTHNDNARHFSDSTYKSYLESKRYMLARTTVCKRSSHTFKNPMPWLAKFWILISKADTRLQNYTKRHLLREGLREGVNEWVSECVCVRACVCVREREREREGGGGGDRGVSYLKSTHMVHKTWIRWEAFPSSSTSGSPEMVNEIAHTTQHITWQYASAVGHWRTQTESRMYNFMQCDQCSI